MAHIESAHAALIGPRDITSCLGNKGGVAIGLLPAGFQIRGHLFRSPYVSGDMLLKTDFTSIPFRTRKQT
jgi:hypothetical protein